MPMKNELEKTLQRAHIAFFGGLGLLLLCLMLLNGSVGANWAMIACSAAGVVAAFGGVIYAAVCFRCPHCGVSLMAGGRMPMSVPGYCSSCGEKLN